MQTLPIEFREETTLAILPLQNSLLWEKLRREQFEQARIMGMARVECEEIEWDNFKQ